MSVSDLVRAQQNENKKLVNNINNRLIQLRNDNNRKVTSENKNLKKVANIVEKFFNFDKQLKR